MLGSLWRVVGIGQPLGAVGQQILQLEVAEPGQRQIKPAERQLAEFEPQLLRIPPRTRNRSLPRAGSKNFSKKSAPTYSR
jgi:hypothetical protein